MTTEWNIGCIVYKRALLMPNKTAVVYEDEPVTYLQLNQRVNRSAHMLQHKGLKKGDRLCVVLLNCIEFLELYFAAAKLGIVFVPLNWRMVGPELEYQINDSGAKMVVFHDAFLGSIDLIRNKLNVDEDKFVFLKSGTPEVPGFELPGCPPWAEDYLKLVAGQSEVEPVPDKPVELTDPISIVYTSGVTGSPKGAVLSHEQTFFKNFQVGYYADFATDDVIIAQMPLFHSGGLFIITTPGLSAGLTIIMRRGFDASEFARDIERYQGTIVFALTTMWRLILETGQLDEIDTRSVRCVLGGGERTPSVLFEELAKRGLYLQQGFGQTENSAMTLVPKKDIQRKMGSIGKPGFFTDIWITSPTGERLPPGEIGEIVAKGPTVMSGYWNKPEETARTIINGVLYTGDLGYVDEEGFFYIVDRNKDMYRSGGENIYPAEVEKVLVGHPKINNVAIIGVLDRKWGEVGLACVVPEKDASISKEEINAFLEGKVARYKYPAYLEIMAELPLTATMKVKKIELKQKFERSYIGE